MSKNLMVGLLAGLAISGGAQAATLTGDTVNFDLQQDGVGVIATSFVAGPGTDLILGAHEADVDVGMAGDGFTLDVDSGSYCGFICGSGSVISFVFSDLDFTGGETLIGFNLTASLSNFIGFTILSPSAISFDFAEGAYSVSADTIIAGGTFITAPAAVPLPAGGLLLLGGLAALGASRRRRA